MNVNPVNPLGCQLFTGNATKLGFFSGREKMRVHFHQDNSSYQFAIGILKGLTEQDKENWDPKKIRIGYL